MLLPRASGLPHAGRILADMPEPYFVASLPKPKEVLNQARESLNLLRVVLSEIDSDPSAAAYFDLRVIDRMRVAVRQAEDSNIID